MLTADQEAKLQADTEAKIKPIFEEARRRADFVQVKLDAGMMTNEEAMKETGKILMETRKAVCDKAVDVIARAAVRNLFDKMSADGMLGSFASGGIYNDTRPVCAHGRKGECLECNTEKIDAMNDRPGTITITNRS